MATRLMQAAAAATVGTAVAAAKSIEKAFPAETPAKWIQKAHDIQNEVGNKLTHIIGYHAAGSESFHQTTLRFDEEGHPAVTDRSGRTLFYGAYRDVVPYAFNNPHGGTPMVGIVAAERAPTEGDYDELPEVEGQTMPYQPPLTAEGQQRCGVRVVHVTPIDYRHDPRFSAAFQRAMDHLDTNGLGDTFRLLVSGNRTN